MKRLFLSLFFGLFVLSLSAQDALTGTWKMDVDNTVVKIEKQHDVFIGKVVSSDNKDATPGTVVIKDAEFDNGLLKGQLYLFKKKRWFQATFEAQGNKLKVTGKWTIFSHTVHWTKTTD